MTYQHVQQIARDTIAYARTILHPGMQLTEVRRACEEKMLALGADSFWYWDVGAFVFSGDETAVSVSGRTYQTSDRLLAENDIVTIDLSPQVGDTWGDYARTIVLQDGHVVCKEDIRHPEWRSGLAMEDALHAQLLACARPDMTFEELHRVMNASIVAGGFVNLDFSGNLGHSIVRKKDDRIYIEPGNTARLGDVERFTFEPHIARPGSCYGVKKENIYYFDGGKLKVL